ncbi:hypothetical protein BU16DRAFT_528662 [Lophium mytilinum]|uniref:Zn(2)-C6 fungal-type domain-containing protein n=1 Tax=Lophium mytilinum TaxID=390894 RepID=A0A6A6QMK1_9PEZI|nr:hypothetical protein BU16DRAFT_528662 [Lophium mytilinum]
MIGTLKVFKSCDACKSRKVRCTGHGYPGPCENCTRRNVECHFSIASAPKRRNRYERIFGELAQESLSTVFGSKVVKDEPASPFHVMSLNPDASKPPAKASTISVQAPKKVQQSTEPTAESLPELYIDRLLSDRPGLQRQKSETFPFKGNGIFGGDYSGYSLTFFSEGRRQSLSTRLGHNRLNDVLNKADTVINTRLKAKENIITDHVLSKSWTADISSDPNLTSAYIRSFFEQVHPLYPFLDQHAFQETLSNPQFSQILHTNKAWSALYHAVLALGSQYNNGGTFEPGQNRAWQLFSVSLALYPDLVILPDSLIALQAVTAMSVFALSVSCIQIEHTMISESARRAQNLNLIKSRASPDSVYNRAFWVVYSLEKMTTFCAGRGSVFIDADISCPIPYTPTAVFGDFDWFLAFARYGRLLSRSYNSLFSISVASNPISYFVNTISQLMEELEHWRMSIPISVRPGEQFRAHALPGPLSTTVALRVHLLYYNHVLALCRASLHINAEASREDSAKSIRHSESKNLLVKASCAILELTPYIDVSPYTPVWVLAGVPLSGLFVLFDLVIHNPTHPETSTNLALLDVASGHFSRVEYASGGTLPGSLVSEFAHIAREYVRDVQLRAAGQGNRIRWSNTLLNQPTSNSGMQQAQNQAQNQNQNQSHMVMPPPELPGGSAAGVADALFFPISDDPYYMPEGLLMGTDVMDLFGSVMPPGEAGNEMAEAWMQGLQGGQGQIG